MGAILTILNSLSIVQLITSFLVLMILIVLSIIGISKALDSIKERKAHYYAIIEDYSGGTLVTQRHLASKIKLSGTETYAIYIHGLKKAIPIPTESLIEKFDSLTINAKLSDGKWKKLKENKRLKKGFKQDLVAKDANSKKIQKSTESELLMGLHDGKLCLQLATNDSINFFYKNRINQAELDDTSKQIISESKKFFTMNFFKWVESQKLINNWDRLKDMAIPIALILIAFFGFLMYNQGTSMVKDVSANLKPTIQLYVDETLVTQWLENKFNLTGGNITIINTVTQSASNPPPG